MVTALEPTSTRRVFESWSIEVPDAFEETFVAEDRYWHAWDRHRSVSLTSVVVDHDGQPVSARRILAAMVPMPGEPVVELPAGLAGWAISAAAPQPARAGRFISGCFAIRGRVLLVTITADDLAWAHRTLLTIRQRRTWSDSIEDRRRRHRQARAMAEPR